METILQQMQLHWIDAISTVAGRCKRLMSDCHLIFVKMEGWYLAIAREIDSHWDIDNDLARCFCRHGSPFSRFHNHCWLLLLLMQFREASTIDSALHDMLQYTHSIGMTSKLLDRLLHTITTVLSTNDVSKCIDQSTRSVSMSNTWLRQREISQSCRRLVYRHTIIFDQCLLPQSMTLQSMVVFWTAKGHCSMHRNWYSSWLV